MDLAADLLAGSRRALARAITLVERAASAPPDGPAPPDGSAEPASAQAAALLAALTPHAGGAHLVGITGAPGTGKSSLVNHLALAFRAAGRTVGIVAVDPTSPFSGGAILGDRIRMRDLSGDPGVFIRSMASRGSLGGLAAATADVATVLDAAGFDMILVETVGAGQAEVEVARLAHTIVVVEAPGLGDDVQAIKAGILEIADILAVNKADDPRAPNTARALQAMLDLAGGATHPPDAAELAHHAGLAFDSPSTPPPAAPGEGDAPGWQVPIVMTNALSGEGVADLLAAIDAHRDHLRASGQLTRRERARALAELDARLREVLLARLLAAVDPSALAAAVEGVVARRLTARAAARELASALAPAGQSPSQEP